MDRPTAARNRRYFAGACLLAAIVPQAFGSQKPTQTASMKSMTPHQQLLDLLRKLKTAIDMDVIRDPARLRQVTGIEVLEWNEETQWTSRGASRWRFNVEALDTSDKIFGRAETSYRPGSDRWKASLLVGGLDSVACVSPGDADAILGRARVLFQPQALPYHAPPLKERWYARSYLHSAATDTLLTLSYAYQDESLPKATCLTGLAIELGKPLPVGYAF